MSKRPIEEFNDGALVPVLSKKAKNELVSSSEKSQALAEIPVARTSSLTAPIIQLEGHQGEVYTCKFHPSGEIFASAGYDRQIFLWKVYGESENYGVIPAHQGSILDLQFTVEGDKMFTASTDKTVHAWDLQTGTRLKKFKGHSSYVNSCSVTRSGVPLLCSVSDDCTLKIWDLRTRKCAHTHKDNCQLLSATFNDGGEQIVFGGIENLLKVFDLRKNDVFFSMAGHGDSITGLTLSPGGTHVLSNSMDNTLCIWDIRPYAPQNRLEIILQGHQHNFEKNLLRCSWSLNGKQVTAGSADRFVYVWDTYYRQILYKLPGHRGSVNEIVFHPKEPIILSCSSDKTLFLGEIDP